MKRRGYDFHGVRIDVAADDARVAEAIDGRLAHFRSESAAAPDVRFTYLIGGTVEPPRGPTRPVYEPPAGRVTYGDAEDVLFIEYGDIGVRCEPARGQVVVAAPQSADVWLLSRPFFTLPLVEVLKRRGLYCVHAAGAAVGDRAVLLPGASGSGKSTVAVALARAGFAFLADDMVFLTNGEDLRIHAFPDETDVSDETAAFFPELEDLVGRIPDGWPKHRIRPEERFGAPIALSCEPAALVFPRATGEAESRLEPMAPQETLLELAPNVLLTDAACSQAHLDALGRLARTTPAHRLRAGRDFDRVAELARELIRG